MGDPMVKHRSQVGGICWYCKRDYGRGEWIIRLAVRRFAHLDCSAAGEVSE